LVMSSLTPMSTIFPYTTLFRSVVAIVRQLRWLVLDRETCIPASCFTANRQGLDFALDVPMLFDFDVADFRELQLAVQFESALRIRETVVTVASFEPRESSFLPTLDSTEERFVGLVQSTQ